MTAQDIIKIWDKKGFLEDRFIEFAQFHVKQALKAVSKRINKDKFSNTSILNCYPLNKIK